MIARIPGLVVLPGFACNFYCDHCISRYRNGGQLTKSEISLLAKTIQKHRIAKLNFVGGEPTLYKSAINGLLAKAKFAGAVGLTTNGHFAGSVAAARKELLGYPGLKSVQLSYDRFHARFLPFSNIRNLFSACRELNVKFSVVLSLESPLDMAAVQTLKKAGNFQIGVQKVIPAGAAKKNGIGYKYPVFDRGILGRGCPNKGTLAFLHGYGFSVCCGAPDFTPGRVKYAHPTLEAHLGSRFYKLITQKTFGAIMRALRVRIEKFPPEFSEPCVLCEHIFSAYAKK